MIVCSFGMLIVQVKSDGLHTATNHQLNNIYKFDSFYKHSCQFALDSGGFTLKVLPSKLLSVNKKLTITFLLENSFKVWSLFNLLHGLRWQTDNLWFWFVNGLKRAKMLCFQTRSRRASWLAIISSSCIVTRRRFGAALLYFLCKFGHVKSR